MGSHGPPPGVRLRAGLATSTVHTAALAGSPVNDGWQAEMAELIDPLTDPATGFHQHLEETFHLD